MSFWTNNSAAPSWWHIVLPKNPHYLRKVRASPPQSDFTIRRAEPAQADPLSEFLRAHYGGEDWYFDATPKLLTKYLNDPNVIVLLAHDAEFTIVATIFSTPLGKTYMSHGAVLPQMRVIEGLCVAPSLRSRGLAGQMIAAMDYITSAGGPVAHLWSRELPYALPLTTAAQVATYAYIRCKDAQARAQVQRATWLDLQLLWPAHVRQTLRKTDTIIADSLNGRRGDLDVWRGTHRGITHVIVVTNTRRRTKTTHEPIYEVVWCGASDHAHMKVCLEAVAAQYSGLFFVTSSEQGGGATVDWESPWVYGTSGAHAWYVYNYIPPTFGSCELHLIREEL